jgi:hypothetical protein
MDWSKLAEEKIAEAMATGELKPVAGVGLPLNMDVYFSPRDEDRIASHVLRTSGHVPEEVSLLQEKGQLREKLKTQRDGEKRDEMKKRLALVEVDLAMRLERRMTRGPK